MTLLTLHTDGCLRVRLGTDLFLLQLSDLLISVFSCSRRIGDNELTCDCNLIWLSKWLRQNPTMGLFTRCASPSRFRNTELAELEESELICDSNDVTLVIVVMIINF